MCAAREPVEVWERCPAHVDSGTAPRDGPAAGVSRSGDSPFELTSSAGPEPPRAEACAEAACYRVPWAELLRKVLAIDVLECPRCAGLVELIAFIADGGVARRILAHLGLATHPPPLAKARAAEDELPADPGPDYGVAGPTCDD